MYIFDFARDIPHLVRFALISRYGLPSESLLFKRAFVLLMLLHNRARGIPIQHKNV